MVAHEQIPEIRQIIAKYFLDTRDAYALMRELSLTDAYRENESFRLTIEALSNAFSQ